MATNRGRYRLDGHGGFDEGEQFVERHEPPSDLTPNPLFFELHRGVAGRGRRDAPLVVHEFVAEAARGADLDARDAAGRSLDDLLPVDVRGDALRAQLAALPDG